MGTRREFRNRWPRLSEFHVKSQLTTAVLPWFLLVLLCLPLVAGCGGCRSETPDTAELDEDKKPKPDFELTSLTVLPSSLDEEEEEEEVSDAQEEDDEFEGLADYDSVAALARTAIKPGHWVQIRHRMRANNFDFVGEMSANVLDRDLRPVTLERSPFRLVSTRPTSLPKEQQKYVDAPVLIPEMRNANSRMVQLGTQLRFRSGGRLVDFGGRPTVRLSAYQFFFVVLSNEPERYGYLKTLSVIRPPDAADAEWDALPGDYAVKFINVEQPLPLPSNSLAWTSTAYLIWDDFDPAALSIDQQSALLDWLHWGGRMIISGPKSLDMLRGSFLEPYLPAFADRTLTISDEVLEPFNDYWTVYPRKPQRKRSDYDFKVGDKPMEVVQLELTDGAAFVPNTGDLVAERRIGRGLVTTTAFSLTDRRTVNWPAFDSFFNGCLMRRPPRRFALGPEGFEVTKWVDSPLRRDARLTSGLRYFVRDAGSEASLVPPSGDPIERAITEAEATNVVPMPLPNPYSRRQPTSVKPPPQGYVSSPISGIAGWTDFSSVANAARHSLQSSSGINVPDRKFVAQVLGAYLFCLVPLNWLLFRLMGRVEWAWIAAPVVAILGGVGIVKMAELDIGFVRARTELAVVEMQDGYPRAHVTRYTGLYTSLSSDYAVLFEDATALAAPFSTNPSSDQLRLQAEADVQYRQEANVGMSGFPVISNSTGMVHVEQIMDIGGSIQLVEESGQLQVINETTLSWDDAFVLLRESPEKCRLALLNGLAAGATEPVRFAAGDASIVLNDYLNKDAATGLPSMESDQINLRQLVAVASSSQQLDVGEYRLIGWNSEEVPGMEVRPDSNQAAYRTLLVANLKYVPFPNPQPDANLYESFGPEEN